MDYEKAGIRLKLDAVRRQGCTFCGAGIDITENEKNVKFLHATAPERGTWQLALTWEYIVDIGGENVRQVLDEFFGEMHGIRERVRR